MNPETTTRQNGDRKRKLKYIPSNGTQSGLPLGQNSSFLAAVTEANVAPSKAWGLWAGDRSLSPIDGALTIGGYDPGRVAGNFATFPLGTWTLQQPCPLQVTVISIMYNQPNETFELLSSENMVACIEPFQDRFTFTPDVVNKVANVTSYDSSYRGLTYPVAQAPDGNMTITLENNYTTVISNSKFVALERGSDQFGHFQITNSSVVETEIVYNAQSDPSTVQPILGGIFLTFNYLVVDYESDHFQLAPAVQGNQHTGSQAVKAICTPTPTSNPSSSSSPPLSSWNKSRKTGIIVGGTVGGVAGLAIMGVLVLLFRRHRQQQRVQELTIEPSDRGAQLSPRLLSVTPSEKVAHSSPSELPLSLAPAVHEMPGNPRSGLHPRAVDRHSGTVGGSVS
ncbi:hypothetical protein HO173_002597 [Letharia columbiana]|uniref:Peptidase A1 domain-containing protein n=1 Tax=Letharia columbiana TaxID=112416 RepID=A0A8H6L8E1_9LECA|nr:uncharacterized protein HO173_002597 [Letharia columbiana]KAF6239335.1 hypothetical protein HO173_002597 [Letharia columbiana]